MAPLPRALAIAIGAACVFGASAQTPVAELGKQRAAASSQQWELREAGHPTLGPIVFAILARPVSTPVGAHSISSNVYVSCERTTGKIAIELVNGRRADDPLGLKPKTLPRLTCNTLDSNGAAISEPLSANWNVNELGDVMARGLWPSSLRACASIGIAENLSLPPEWGRDSARIDIEIAPYSRELDSVFARCGEPAVYSPLAAGSVAPAPIAPKAAAPAPNAVARNPVTPRSGAKSTEALPWSTARTIPEGHTNVRAKADIKSALVIRLDPGDIVLVQKSDADWWHARSRPAARNPFEGYIRRDRLGYP